MNWDSSGRRSESSTGRSMSRVAYRGLEHRLITDDSHIYCEDDDMSAEERFYMAEEDEQRVGGQGLFSTQLSALDAVDSLLDTPKIHANEFDLDVSTSLSQWRNINQQEPTSWPQPLLVYPPTVQGPSNDGECQGILFDESVTCSKREFVGFRHEVLSTINRTPPTPDRILWDYQNRTTPFRLSRANRNAISQIYHYQLRHQLVCSSRHRAYYQDKCQVFHVDPSATPGSLETPKLVMDLWEQKTELKRDCHASTLNTVCGNILMAGTFGGQYAYIDLESERNEQKPLTIGRASNASIINFIDSTTNSPNSPSAVISINHYQNTLAVVDCTRNEIIQNFDFQKSITRLSCPERAIVNCTTTSSDGRIRLLVGDFSSALVIDARSGRVIHEIENTHDENGTFACAWAPSGPMFATAGEDNRVCIWDARMWKATAQFSTFMAPVRNLAFSPLGQGPPTLFAGEAVDLVHVLDVGGSDDMFWTRQRMRSTLCERRAGMESEWLPTDHVPARMQILHHFGDNAGIAISPDGGELMLANGDPHFGGLIVWERTSWDRPSDGRLERRPRYTLPEHSGLTATEHRTRKKRRV